MPGRENAKTKLIFNHQPSSDYGAAGGWTRTRLRLTSARQVDTDFLTQRRQGAKGAKNLRFTIYDLRMNVRREKRKGPQPKHSTFNIQPQTHESGCYGAINGGYREPGLRRRMTSPQRPAPVGGSAERTNKILMSKNDHHMPPAGKSS